MSIVEQALQFEGLTWLIVAVVLSGLVRGFAGFGTALVFMPIAASVTSPIWAIIIMMSFDLLGPIALLPRAWRDGETREITFLGIGALVGLPFGVYFLTKMDPIIFRWMVSSLSLVMLTFLVSGWRYKNPMNIAMMTFVGLISGFLAGIAALPGPPVILSYISGSRPASVIRGNTMMYLFLVDIMTFIVFLIVFGHTLCFGCHRRAEDFQSEKRIYLSPSCIWVNCCKRFGGVTNLELKYGN